MWQAGIQDGGEGGVRLERLGQVLRARGTDVVAPEPANEERGMVLRGIDSKEGQAGSVLERGEGLVESEPLRESLGALGTKFVRFETAKERRGAMSKGIDSKAGGPRAHILELLEGGVGGNGVSHVLCPLWLEAVALETAHQ